MVEGSKVNMKTKKVAQLTTVHPRYDTRILVKTSASLAERGFEVVLLVADSLEDELVSGVRIVNIGESKGNRVVKTVNRLVLMFRAAVKENADIYHFHDPELMLIAPLLKLKGKVVIYDIHEDVPRQVLRKKWIPFLLRKPISLLVRALESVVSRLVDGIVTVTPTIASRFPLEKTIETRNYVDLKEFDSYDPIKPKSLITYVGGITEARGILPMVSAFENLSANLTLVGKFQESGLENKCKNTPGWHNVNFIGWQSRKSIVEILDETQIGLVVLQATGDYEEAFPVKLFEYMAAGAAVIASDFPLWRGIIDGAECGICVDPASATAIEEAIIYLKNNPDIAKKMGLNGRKAVVENYNWENQATNLFNMYSKLLSV